MVPIASSSGLHPFEPLVRLQEPGLGRLGRLARHGQFSHRFGNFLQFEEARGVARSARAKEEGRLGEVDQVRDRCPDDLPATPNEVYKDTGWAGWGDWLGNGVVANQNRVFLPFEEARAYARPLGLRTRTEWAAWAKSTDRPASIPSSPLSHLQEPGLGRLGRLAPRSWSELADSVARGRAAAVCRVPQRPPGVTDARRAVRAVPAERHVHQQRDRRALRPGRPHRRRPPR